MRFDKERLYKNEPISFFVVQYKVVALIKRVPVLAKKVISDQNLTARQSLPNNASTIESQASSTAFSAAENCTRVLRTSLEKRHRNTTPELESESVIERIRLIIGL